MTDLGAALTDRRAKLCRHAYEAAPVGRAVCAPAPRRRGGQHEDRAARTRGAIQFAVGRAGAALQRQRGRNLLPREARARSATCGRKGEASEGPCARCHH